MEKTINQSAGTFSLERFFRLVKVDFTVNKSNYLKLLLATTGVFVAVAVMISINAANYVNEMVTLNSLTDGDFSSDLSFRLRNYTKTYCAIGLWILCLGMTIFGSLTFSNLSNKRHRISALMLPSSPLEKFTLRMMIYLFGGITTLVVGYLIGILILQFTIGGFDVLKGCIHELAESINMVGIKIGHKHFAGVIAALLTVMFLFYNSIYTLGSALWPHLSWLKTWIVLTVVQWIAAIVLITVVLSGFDFEKFINFDLEHYVVSFIYTLIATFSVLNIICWVLAWIRYKNTQIIQRFMKK